MLNSITRDDSYYLKFYDEILKKIKDIKSEEDIDINLKSLQNKLLSDECNITSVIEEYKKIYNIEENEYKKTLGYCNNALPDELDNLFSTYELKWKYVKQLLKMSGIRDEIYNLSYDGSHIICPACGLPIGKEIGLGNNDYRTLEHILPKSSYGKYLFYIDNLIPLCKRCNEKKKDKFALGKIYNPFFINYSIDIEKHLKIAIDPKDKNYLSYVISDDSDNFIKEHFYLYNLGGRYRESIFLETIVKKNFKALIENIKIEQNPETREKLIKRELNFMLKNIEDFGEDYHIIKSMTINQLIDNIETFTNFLIDYN